MVSTTLLRLALAASLFSLASVTSAQPQLQQESSSSPRPNEADSSTGTDKPRAMEAKGCFSSSEPLESKGEAEFPSTGECQVTCAALDLPVMALVDGETCYCGELLPPKDAKIGMENCNTPCAGYDLETCGGNGVFEVFLTGTTLNEIKNFEPEVKDKESSSTNAAPSVITEVVTPTPVVDAGLSEDLQVQEEEDDGGSSGVSTAAIAAGSVAGVLGIASVIGAVFLYMRHRKRREAEEAFKHAVSANSFIEEGKRPPNSSGSGSDSRLDPVTAQRRMSDGSIADNEDYSRRILQVTNPDGMH